MLALTVDQAPAEFALTPLKQCVRLDAPQLLELAVISAGPILTVLMSRASLPLLIELIVGHAFPPEVCLLW